MSASDLTRTDLFEQSSNAVFSEDMRHRYWLHRRWGRGTGWAVFVMLNPSTAGVSQDDATIRACTGFAKKWLCEGLIVVNLFSYRATDPAELLAAVKRDEPVVGDQNHAYVTLAAELASTHHPELERERRRPGKMVCAWGALPYAKSQVQETLGWIEAASLVTPQCLGTTKSGAPRHPLYTPFSTILKPYD